MRLLFREIRAFWRLSVVFAMISGGIFTACLIFPLLGQTTRRSVKQRWAAFLVYTLGLRIEANTRALPTGVLVVCNHISWLDVFILNALAPTTFVCKDDVKNWPALGTLVAHSGTLFIERGSRSAAARTAHSMAERLRQGERVAVFPEGTTTQGTTLLPFRAALFQAAIEAKTGVQPVALRYLDRQGTRCLAPAYDGDVTFAESMLAIVRSPRIIARLEFLECLPCTLERRELAQQTEKLIATTLGLATPEHAEAAAEAAEETVSITVNGRELGSGHTQAAPVRQ